MSKLDIDTFGEIMDQFIEDADIQMLIEIPHGTIVPIVRDNIHMGGVVQLYILLQAISPIYKSVHDHLLDPSKNEQVIDAILGLVKKDMMDAVEEASA